MLFNLPLGILAKNELVAECPDPQIQKAALVNVCQIPLQASAYANSWVLDKYGEELPKFEEIRVANQRTTFRDKKVEAIQWVIANSLRKKLLKKTANPLYIVPCGRFAQKFSQLAVDRWHPPPFLQQLEQTGLQARR